MIVLVCYDIGDVAGSGARRLRKVAQACQDYGERVQFSVFECRLDRVQWVVLRNRLLEVYEPTLDSLRFYFVSDDDARRTEHHGARTPIDPSGPLVV